jgi:hypothetical protein
MAAARVRTRRTLDINRFVGFRIASVFVAVVALIGCGLDADGSVRPLTSSTTNPHPSATPEPSAMASPSVSPALVPPHGSLTAGERYEVKLNGGGPVDRAG